MLPEDTIFSHKSHTIFPREISENLVLANINSTLHRFIANGLNPGRSFEVGDAKRFPIKTDYANKDAIEALVSVGVEERKSISSLTEISADFDGEAVADLLDRESKDLQLAEEAMEARVLVAHGVTDTLIFDEYDITQETREQMYANLPKNTAGLTVAAEAHVEYPVAFDKHINIKSVGEERLNEAVETLADMDDPTLREAALETDLSPLTVAQLRYDHNLYSEDERVEAAGRVVSLILGALFDRWDTQHDLPTVKDEIIAFDTGRDVAELFNDALAVLFEDGHAAEQAMESALGHSLVDWLRERFFRRHHVEEYKPRGERSPIYWQLESPQGAFSCYVYYHEIDENTLPKLRGQYLDPRIDEVENELETLTTQTSGDNPDKELLNRKEEIQNNLNDIREFRDTIDKMIDDGVTVDVEKGIWENIKEWDRYEILETGLPKLKSSYSR
jgi:hypothetical protein